ncbi:NUDIX domain-containing protein [Hymenobacter sp. HD11105]
MNFEPQKFFIGLLDFFSVLLPGALLTFLVMNDLGPLLLGKDYGLFAGEQGWIAFFFSSYLLGHFVFLLGSLLFDDVYDQLRQATDHKQRENLANGKKAAPGVAVLLAKLFFSKQTDQTVQQVVKIKNQYLSSLGSSETVNAFQWCKTRLTFDHPQALATVHGFEAHSKFFRSLLIVLCVLLIQGMVQGQPTRVLASVPLMAMAFWRFVDQRSKAVTQAYWYIISAEGRRSETPRPLILPAAESPARAGGTHVGGVVFRQHAGQVHYLTVQDPCASLEWGFPRGRVQPGEKAPTAALRLIQQETEVLKRFESELLPVSYEVKKELVSVLFYLFEAKHEGAPTNRPTHDWVPLDTALDRIKHPASRELLLRAETMRLREEGNNQQEQNPPIKPISWHLLPLLSQLVGTIVVLILYWTIYLYGAQDGRSQPIFPPGQSLLEGLRLIGITILFCLFMGLPLRFSPGLHRWWRQQWYVAVTGATIGSFMLFLPWSPLLVSPTYSPLPPNLLVATSSWLLVAFSLLHFYLPAYLFRWRQR